MARTSFDALSWNGFWQGPESRGWQGFRCKYGPYEWDPDFPPGGPNESCILNVTGQLMSPQDRMLAIGFAGACLDGPAVPSVLPLHRDSGVPYPSHYAWAGTEHEGLARAEDWMEFDLGVPQGSGVFQLCYCPGDYEDCADVPHFFKWVRFRFPHVGVVEGTLTIYY